MNKKFEIGYLRAKKSIDDHSINRNVFQSLKSSLPNERIDVLDIGGGIGASLERSLEWNLFDEARYKLLDNDAELISNVPSRLRRWTEECGMEMEKIGAEEFLITGGGKEVKVELEGSDFFDFADRDGGGWDLVMSNSFMDLVNVQRGLDTILKLAGGEGHLYFTSNFDGETILKPEVKKDEEILEKYHSTMEGKSKSRNSGREILYGLMERSTPILDAGSSDWVVYPSNGEYTDDELVFLNSIIKTIERAVEDKVEGGDLRDWVNRRREQIEKGKLVYIAHQLDVAGKVTRENPEDEANIG